jgi:hypothetical protein
LQGSALTRLTAPEALNVSSVTMMARTNRRTTEKFSTQAAERRDCALLPAPTWPTRPWQVREELRYDESAHSLYADARGLESPP